MNSDNEEKIKKCPICGHGIFEGSWCSRMMATVHVEHCYSCRYFVRQFAHCMHTAEMNSRKKLDDEHSRVRKMIEEFGNSGEKAKK